MLTLSLYPADLGLVSDLWLFPMYTSTAYVEVYSFFLFFFEKYM